MESLSSYDRGKKSFEGRRYKADIAAAHRGMRSLFAPYGEYLKEMRRKRKRPWKPELHLTLGNHCQRIVRAIEEDAKLEGTIGIEDLKYEEFGWTVHPFLQPVFINEVAFAHYYIPPGSNRAISKTATLLANNHMSCVAGHLQGKQISTSQRIDGRCLTAIIAGSCYLEDFEYLSPQKKNYWRGILVLNELENGSFSEICVSLKWLEASYSHKNAWKRKG